MWKQKLGINFLRNETTPAREQFRMIRAAGFEAAFLMWDDRIPTAQWAGACREEGLDVQSVHALWEKTPLLWDEPGRAGEEAADWYVRCLEDCSRLEVPIMVTHAIMGFDADNMPGETRPVPTDLGVERYARILDAAEKLGVQVAVENTEGEVYLEKLFSELGGHRALGFCWDSGHEQCYNRSLPILEKYASRLIATHINDNLGVSDHAGTITWRDDLHLLPWDGIGDWDENARRLRNAGCPEILTFELTRTSKPGRHDCDAYARLELAEFYALAYARACRLASAIHRETPVSRCPQST